MFVKVGKTFVNLDQVMTVCDADNCAQVRYANGQTVEFAGADAAAILAAVNPPVPEKMSEPKKIKS